MPFTSQFGLGEWGDIFFGENLDPGSPGITPEPGSLVFTTFAPGLSITIPTATVLTFTGFAPSLEREITIPPGALVFAGFPPIVPVDTKSHFPVPLAQGNIRTVVLPDPNRSKFAKRI